MLFLLSVMFVAAGPVSGPRSQLHQRPCIYPIKRCMHAGKEGNPSQILHTEPSSNQLRRLTRCKWRRLVKSMSYWGLAGACRVVCRNYTIGRAWNAEAAGRRGQNLLSVYPRLIVGALRGPKYARGSEGYGLRVVSLILRAAAAIVTGCAARARLSTLGCVASRRIPTGIAEEGSREGRAAQGRRGGWRERRRRCCKQRTTMGSSGAQRRDGNLI